MAEHRRRVSGRSGRHYSDQSARNAYIYGNTVQRAETAPERREQTTIEVEEPKRASRQVRKNRKKALHMSAGYVMFLALAAAIGLGACVKFLQLRADVTSSSKKLAAMQQELVALKEDNTSKYNSVVDSVSLDDVRERAIEDLKMVYAKPGQIIEYQNPENDYVKQYQNIPENGVSTVSGKIAD